MTLTIRDFLSRLRWLDGRPFLPMVEPYRMRLFEQFFARDERGGFRYNLGLDGRAKKNNKTLDLVLRAFYRLLTDDVPGYDSECYLLANDEDQAGDDLSLGKKLVKANPVLQDQLNVKRDSIERRDGRGFLQVLPAGDVVGQHGKSYAFVGYDEVHGYRDWGIFEAMQPDPHRPDVQQSVTSYAGLHHRPGVPLFDMMQRGRAGLDAQMLFSWYGADFTTDAAFADLTPEERANPSMASWGNANYLDQQRRRLPAHKFRRLHLNLPGLPEGAPFAAESVMDAVERGVTLRHRDVRVDHRAFVDMSGGSNDDAVLAIGHRRADGRYVVDRLVEQGCAPPFDPRRAIERFVPVLREYSVVTVTGDAYAGQTFRKDFEHRGINYVVADATKSEMYEALEPKLNAHEVVLPDVPRLEQQLLGLVWRGGRIDHQSGEHDDFANAAAGVIHVLSAPSPGASAGAVLANVAGTSWQDGYFR